MKFRNWIMQEEERGNNIRHFIDSQGMILFFKKNDDYFGAGEDSRVIFAKLKHPDGETPSGWDDEATFTATNLSKLVKGQPSTHVFDKSDLKKIKVVDKEHVIDKLKDVGDSNVQIGDIRIIRFGIRPNSDRDEAPNFVRANEK
jgi:hypothetical protein